VSHPLLGYLLDAAAGRFPPVDGQVTYVPPLECGMEAVVAFTGHSVIASRLPRADLADLQPDGFGRSLAPAVLMRLGGIGRIGEIDVTLVAPGAGGGSLPLTVEWDEHPRAQRARRLRSDVVVYGDERGFVTLGQGLAGRREMSIEIPPECHSSGTGRRLIAEARALVEPTEWVFAGVSPGNARSLRAFLSQGFVPIGSEVLIEPNSIGSDHA
jgi:hypothetical protein